MRWTDMRLAIAILCAGCAANVTDVSRLSFQLDRVQLDVVLTDAAREDIGSTPAVESKFGEIGVALVRYD